MHCAPEKGNDAQKLIHLSPHNSPGLCFYHPLATFPQKTCIMLIKIPAIHLTWTTVALRPRVLLKAPRNGRYYVHLHENPEGRPVVAGAENKTRLFIRGLVFEAQNESSKRRTEERSRLTQSREMASGTWKSRKSFGCPAWKCNFALCVGGCTNSLSLF